MGFPRIRLAAFFLVSPLLLIAQSTVPDSIRKDPSKLPVSQKYTYAQIVRQEIMAMPDPGEQKQEAFRLRDAAVRTRDSVLLKYACELLDTVYRLQGDAKTAHEYNRERKGIAGRYGWHVAEGYQQTHPYFGYRYSRLYDELRIFGNASSRLSFDSIEAMADQSWLFRDFGGCDSDAGGACWVRLRLHGLPYEDGVWFFSPAYGYSAGNRQFSWDTVDVFVRFADGRLIKRHTGYALAPEDRQIRDAFNLFSIPVAAGQEATLYLCLKGRREARRDENVFLEFIDPATLSEFEGFRPSDHYPLGAADGVYSCQPVWRSLEIAVDSSGGKSFLEMKKQWPARGALQSRPVGDWSQVYWARIRLLGTGKRAERLLFEFPPAADWAEIDAFWPGDSPGYYLQARLGQRLPVAGRLVTHWRSLLSYDLQPRDTVDLFFRLEGFLGDPAAEHVELYRIDESAFWPQMPYRTLFAGLVLGALGVGLVYFLLRAWLVWDGGSLFFALFLLGATLTFALWDPWDRGAVLFPAWRPYFSYLLLAGQFFLLFGLLSFAGHRLRVGLFYPWARLLIPGFLVLWLGLNLIWGIAFGGEWDLHRLPGFDSVYLRIAAGGLVLLGFLSFLVALKGHTPAYLFLAAFFLMLVCAVLLITMLIVGNGWPEDQPVFYVVEAGLAFVVLLLALGAGVKPE